MPTVTADERIVAPPEPLTYDAAPADILDRAADLLLANGRYPGHYWEDAYQSQWWPGMPCSADAAIGLALGRHRAADVTSWVVPCVQQPDELPHPAMGALMAHLGYRTVQDVFVWSDTHEASVLAGEMRVCAARLRVESAVTCVSCGAEYPNHYSTCEFIRPVPNVQPAGVAS